MINDRSILIRNHILHRIETGEFPAGGRLPGARQIAGELKCSFTHVQSVIESLGQAGILEVVPRSGAFVCRDWAARLLPYNFHCPVRRNIPVLHGAVADASRTTGLWPGSRFNSGTFEIRVTHAMMANCDAYLDLTELFEELCGDDRTFFRHAAQSLLIDGKLYGIPLVFSPRAILYNPELFARCGCPEPRPGWSYDEFLATVRRLKEQLPGDRVFNWSDGLQDLINSVVRAGGALFHINGESQVRIATPETVGTLTRHVELRELLGLDTAPRHYLRDFAAGEAAMLQDARQILYTIRRLNPALPLRAVQLPRFPDGRDVNIQGADLFCVRKNCSNLTLVRKILTELLSKRTQDRFGESGYGIPFRRSSAMKYLKKDDSLDAVFLAEIPKTQTDYNIFSPEIYQLVYFGIARLCHRPSPQVPELAAQLAGLLSGIGEINDFRDLQLQHQGNVYDYDENPLP